jgi:hypothetical protein
VSWFVRRFPACGRQLAVAWVLLVLAFMAASPANARTDTPIHWPDAHSALPHFSTTLTLSTDAPARMVSLAAVLQAPLPLWYDAVLHRGRESAEPIPHPPRP